jgi:hypothetical protein
VYNSIDSISNKKVYFYTSGYPWSNPIRVNDFSLTLSLIGIFLYGLPGTIVSAPGQPVFAPGNPWDGSFGRVD